MRVLVRHAVCERLDRAAEECGGQPEMGGILLGAYRGRDLDVTGLTKPAPGDVRHLLSFDRSDPAHQAAAHRAWSSSRGTHTYVGEWHTHPWGGVMPSSTDIRSWRVEVRRGGRAMAFALVAPGEWGLFLVRPKLFWAARGRLIPIERGKVGRVFVPA